MNNLLLILGAALMAGPACTDHGDVASDPNALVGTVADDFPIDDGTTAVVMWSVVVGDDHEYRWGEGDVIDGVFSVHLEGEPPEGARNFDPDVEGANLADATAIGHVLAFDPSDVPPEGEVDWDSALEQQIRGFGFRHAVLWFPHAMTDAHGNAHEGGFECGRCVPGERTADGDRLEFDWYEPAPCDEVELYGLPNGWVEDDPRYPEICEFT